jgi:hypothetical protein
MQFNFNFGKKKPTIIQYAIIGTVLTVIISSFAACTKLNENQIWDLLDEIQRVFHISILNDFIITDPEKLDRRVKRDVDRAIDQYNEEYDKLFPRHINMKNQTILNAIKDKSKYTDTQRLIVENAEYYEFPPDGSKSQDLLGGMMGIRSIYNK